MLNQAKRKGQKLKSIFSIVAIGAGVAFALPACTNSSSDDPPAVATYFVKGDPQELIAGTVGVAQSPFTAQSIRMLSNYSMSSLVQFVERSRIVKKSRDHIKENAPKESQDDPENHRITITETPQGGVQIGILRDRVSLQFRNDQGRMQLYQMASSGHAVDVKVEHWSQLADGQMFSVLVSGNEPDSGRFLMSIYFERNGPSKLPDRVDKRYVYVGGEGRPIPLLTDRDGKATFQFCSKHSSYVDEVRQGVNEWNKALEGTSLSLNFVVNPAPAPFSDLTQKCVHVIDAYLYEQEPTYQVLGVTLTIPSATIGKIVDADQFMFLNEMRKADRYAQSWGGSVNANDQARKMTIAVRHEMGHAIGLGHKFDGTTSLMSYAFDAITPTLYDKTALKILYPPLATVRN